MRAGALLEGFELLDACRRAADEALEKLNAKSVDPDVPAINVQGARLPPAIDEIVAMPRNGRTAEVERARVRVAHDFDHVGIE